MSIVFIDFSQKDSHAALSSPENRAVITASIATKDTAAYKSLSKEEKTEFERYCELKLTEVSSTRSAGTGKHQPASDRLKLVFTDFETSWQQILDRSKNDEEKKIQEGIDSVPGLEPVLTAGVGLEGARVFGTKR